MALVSVSAPVMPGRNLTNRVLALLERVDYRRVETTEEREAIFRLRYNAYLHEGAIPPNASERFADPDGRIRATLELIWLSGWLPHESQQQPLKPGSATVSMTKVLGNKAK